jgi:hypothetical protein
VNGVSGMVGEIGRHRRMGDCWWEGYALDDRCQSLFVRRIEWGWAECTKVHSIER